MSSWLEMGTLMVKLDEKVLDWSNRQSKKEKAQTKKESQSRAPPRPAIAAAATRGEVCGCKCCHTAEEGEHAG
jgi:hypothetical protein